jgi:excisionase family DNA binding protein
MNRLNLQQAAEFLGAHPETIRKLAKNGKIPARKVGKGWAFIEEDLAAWVSGRYPHSGRELRVIDGGKQQEATCQSNNAVKIKSGGLTSARQTDSAYAKALGLSTKNKH